MAILSIHYLTTTRLAYDGNFTVTGSSFTCCRNYGNTFELKSKNKDPSSSFVALCLLGNSVGDGSGVSVDLPRCLFTTTYFKHNGMVYSPVFRIAGLISSSCPQKSWRSINRGSAPASVPASGHKETVETDRCPVEECPVTFSSKNNERAITIHVKAIVKKGRAYYADKKKGVGFWDAHNKYYEDKMEQRASTEAKKKESQVKYRENHRE
ncbi:hypothetical protein FN846DRAFT_984838 [Sphaerosporella brunnea]|uniref:Uncharacterized protein n=1 Tax=Sphaerosporella brunnea TaxID=1250544 RepID=A0A5J5EVS7_9PEZI|nr:hypothetical protein FN846DRAFT_984838 [Sphaerosporella brunnea]